MTNIISFPKLGLIFNISPVAFTIAGKDIYWYALIILIGFIAGIVIASIGSEKRGLSQDSVLDIAIYGIIAGILGARIYYVLFSLDEFKDDWLDIFRIWEGGLAIYGGVIGALISTSVYCKAKKISILNAFDVCCVGLLLGQSIGRWGNFVNCEVFGRATDFVLGMSINSDPPVHPLFLYESLLSLLGVILLCLFRDRKIANGQVFCRYLFWYSLCRLILEGMRDSKYILYVIPDTLGISQLVAVIAIIASVILSVCIVKRKQKELR